MATEEEEVTTRSRQRTASSKRRDKKDSVPPTQSNSDVVEIVEVEVEYICPKRGRVKQKVKMKKLKPVKTPTTDVIPVHDILVDIEKKQRYIEEEEEEEGQYGEDVF